MRNATPRSDLLGSCLQAFLRAGRLDLSLDQLAGEVGVSKRMLIHYFGSRDAMEEQAMEALEERLRAQFAPERFPAEIGLQQVMAALWRQTTAPESKGVLLLVMDISRRAWCGSRKAKSFYATQQKLWVKLLMNYLADKEAVEDILQSFLGAVLAYLVTGDKQRGQRMLNRLSRATAAAHSRQKPKTRSRP
jgi:AcrR family transcriptional regulator